MAKALEPAFPSSPHRPPKWSLQFFRGDKRVSIQGFTAMYAARKFIGIVLGDNEYKWRDETTIHAEDIGVTIKGDGLEDIMEYKLKGPELEWTIPEPQLSEARFIGTGERKRHTRESVRASRGDDAGGDEANAAPRNGGAKTGRLPPVRREVPDGMISLAQICEEIGMDPRDARAILRKSVEKPEHGWAWSVADAKKIKTTLSGKETKDEEAPQRSSKASGKTKTNGEASPAGKRKSRR